MYLKIIFVLVMSLCRVECTRQVVLSCDNTDADGEGPRNVIVEGARGPKGEPGACRPWLDAVTRLELKLAALQDRIELYPKIQHFVLPSFQVSWALGVTYCERLNLRLCSYDEIFPLRDNVPVHIGIQQGDHWAPIRDLTNDWAEVGNDLNRNGFRHIQHYGPPTWGLSAVPRPYKGHLFCCIPE